MEKQDKTEEKDKTLDGRYQNLDMELVQMIENDMIDQTPPIFQWGDFSSPEIVIRTIAENLFYPNKYPALFSGLRALPRTIFFFGPSGTGKRMITKALACELNFTFFSLSASSLSSKWIGQGEKLIKTLFAVAAIRQPSMIFIDELDLLFSPLDKEEEEDRRRMKTEFLVQLASVKEPIKIFVVGSTNRPQDVDAATRKRFHPRLYFPLPNAKARRKLIRTIIENDVAKGNEYDLSKEEVQKIVELTIGYSGDDLRCLFAEAAMVQWRNFANENAKTREIGMEDFWTALKFVRPTTSEKEIEEFLKWSNWFGFETEAYKLED